MILNMKNKKNSFYLKFISTLAFCLIIALSIFILNKQRIKIDDYCHLRDRQLILDSFEKDWYWLIPDGMQFDPNSVLPENGNLDKIKILLEGNNPVGYVDYKKNYQHIGQIRFLNIIPEKRNKGYAEKLLNAAINDLYKSGSKIIILRTRTNNQKAQKLYKKMGFQEKILNPEECPEKYIDFILK